MGVVTPWLPLRFLSPANLMASRADAGRVVLVSGSANVVIDAAFYFPPVRFTENDDFYLQFPLPSADAGSRPTIEFYERKFDKLPST